MTGVIGTTSFPAVVENMMTMTSNLKPCVALVKVYRNTEMTIFQIHCIMVLLLIHIYRHIILFIFQKFARWKITTPAYKTHLNGVVNTIVVDVIPIGGEQTLVGLGVILEKIVKRGEKIWDDAVHFHVESWMAFLRRNVKRFLVKGRAHIRAMNTVQ